MAKVSPNCGPVGGGTTVAITGVEFAGATSVKVEQTAEVAAAPADLPAERRMLRELI